MKTKKHFIIPVN